MFVFIENSFRVSFLFFLIIFSCSPTTSNSSEPKNDFQDTFVPTVVSDSILITTKQRKKIEELSQEEIQIYSKTNSCYYALLKDSLFFNTLNKPGFEIDELYNDSLSSDNPYRNRYLLGDFMALDENFNSRGIEELNPKLESLIDFKGKSQEFFNLLNDAEKSEEKFQEFSDYVRTLDDSLEILNFYEKIWKFKTPAIKRQFALSNGNAYAVGQKICLCEVETDTINLIAQFATSSKRLEPKSTGGTVEFLPTGKRRYYYASHYRISSKNWESQRNYENLDIEHDNKLGGGNKRVTYYKGKFQLPNFLLMAPAEEYPKAMTSNGIHEVALRELTRGMLGCANSIGCIRVSDFGSKFIRWWVPQNANFFVIYRDDRYFKKLDITSVEEQLPFKNEIEGNAFRQWLIDHKPLKARQLEIDSEGKYDNGYILDAYNLYGTEYENFILSQSNN